MTIIRVEIDSSETERLLNELYRRTNDIRPAMDAIGQILVSNTQQRFVDQKAPDGRLWAGLSDVTKERRRKGGGIGEPQILRDTGRLMNSISYRVAGGSVELGTNVAYAGTHQYGARKGQYGTTRRGAPIPWGDVPARPFFGYNEQDQEDVIELLERYIDASQPDSWWKRLLDKIKRFFS